MKSFCLQTFIVKHYARNIVENNKTTHIPDMLYLLGKQANARVFVCLHIDAHTDIYVCVCICVSKGPVCGQQGQNVRTED